MVKSIVISKNNLSLVNYSNSFKGTLTLEDLKKKFIPLSINQLLFLILLVITKNTGVLYELQRFKKIKKRELFSKH